MDSTYRVPLLDSKLVRLRFAWYYRIKSPSGPSSALAVLGTPQPSFWTLNAVEPRLTYPNLYLVLFFFLYLSFCPIIYYNTYKGGGVQTLGFIQYLWKRGEGPQDPPYILPSSLRGSSPKANASCAYVCAPILAKTLPSTSSSMASSPISSKSVLLIVTKSIISNQTLWIGSNPNPHQEGSH